MELGVCDLLLEKKPYKLRTVGLLLSFYKKKIFKSLTTKQKEKKTLDNTITTKNMQTHRVIAVIITTTKLTIINVRQKKKPIQRSRMRQYHCLPLHRCNYRLIQLILHDICCKHRVSISDFIVRINFE